jgi:hypothetical protein
MSKFGLRLFTLAALVLPLLGLQVACGPGGAESVQIKKVDVAPPDTKSVDPKDQPPGTPIGRTAGKINPVTGRPVGEPYQGKE